MTAVLCTRTGLSNNFRLNLFAVSFVEAHVQIKKSDSFNKAKKE